MINISNPGHGFTSLKKEKCDNNNKKMASNGGDEYGTKKVTLFRHKGSESEGNSSRASSRSGTVKDRSQIDPSLPEHGWRELETIKKYYETQSRA